MARIKRGVTARARHKKILKLAKGYQGRNSSCFRVAVEKVEKGMQYAYRDRRNKKRLMRGLAIQRINALVRQYGISYSRFMNYLKIAQIELDRKVLSEIAITHENMIAELANKAKQFFTERFASAAVA